MSGGKETPGISRPVGEMTDRGAGIIGDGEQRGCVAPFPKRKTRDMTAEEASRGTRRFRR